MKTELVENVIEKIVILKHFNGDTRYALHLANGGQAIITVEQLMSMRLSMGPITEVTNKLYIFPNQKGWVNLIRGLLECAEEKKILEFPESNVVLKILTMWLTQWKNKSNSENAKLFDKFDNSCVVESGTMFFKLAAIEKKMKLCDVKFNRTLLCKFLRTLGARPTEPRQRFFGIKLRTWEIATSDLQP